MSKGEKRSDFCLQKITQAVEWSREEMGEGQ